MSQTRWWFVRHGESVANAESWLAGHRDAPLTPKGIEQATALRTALAQVRPGRVLASDLQRASRTAAIAWNHRLPPPRLARGVRERDLGQWEGRSLLELSASGGMDVLLSWDQAPPGGESHAVLAHRALGFLAEHDDEQSTVIFGHGGWLRAVIGLLDGVPTHQIGTFKVANTEILVRDVPVGTWARLLATIS